MKWSFFHAIVSSSTALNQYKYDTKMILLSSSMSSMDIPVCLFMLTVIIIIIITMFIIIIIIITKVKCSVITWASVINALSYRVLLNKASSSFKLAVRASKVGRAELPNQLDPSWEIL